MITADEFLAIKEAVAAHPEQLNGVPLADHITWSETCGPPEDAEQFALEAIFVICNSGMNHKVARGIFERVKAELRRGVCIDPAMRKRFLGLPPVFGHAGKCQAIDRIWSLREYYFDGYMAADDKVAFCGTLPWIGEITKFHLAKNFGADVAKPDVHLQRMAKRYGTTPQKLCADLAAATGYKARTVDLILWVACAKGVIDSTVLDEVAA